MRALAFHITTVIAQHGQATLKGPMVTTGWFAVTSRRRPQAPDVVR
jgi:hypothetical protein